jgi:hypothetical protein
MDRKVLMNQLTLAYSPLCNYDFTILKTDPVIQNIIENSSLYAIVQRPEIRFDNITNNEEEKYIEFEIRQHNNPNILKCKVPLFQQHIATNPENEVLVYFGSNDKNNKLVALPLNNIHSMKFYEQSVVTENFLFWISPEKFLQNYWDGLIEAEIEGNIHDFTKYYVHYVNSSLRIMQRF